MSFLDLQLTVSAVAALITPASAQPSTIESQLVDALVKYCVATDGRTEAATALAEADGWQPSAGNGGPNARFMMRPGPDPLILAVDLSPAGTNDRRPAYICSIQAQQASAEATASVVRERLNGSTEFTPPTGQRHIFAYVKDGSRLRSVSPATPEAELRALDANNSMIVLIADGSGPTFRLGLMVPASN